MGNRRRLLADAEIFYNLVTQLKHTCRKLLSNYYLSEQALTDAIGHRLITYEYEENAYLNLWYWNGYFERLYYFIAAPYTYEIADQSSVCVCDAVCRVDDQPEIRRILCDAGMHEYAGYARWICRCPVLLDIRGMSDLKVIEEDDGTRFMECLYQCFDAWSDMLPGKSELNRFIRDKHFIGVYEKYPDILIGGMVYTEQTYMLAEEYLFVLPDYQGRGISKLLHNTLYRKYQSKTVKYTAWIRNDNQVSINLHSIYQYEKQNQLKITFLKGEAK